MYENLRKVAQSFIGKVEREGGEGGRGGLVGEGGELLGEGEGKEEEKNLRFNG